MIDKLPGILTFLREAEQLKSTYAPHGRLLVAMKVLLSTRGDYAYLPCW